MIGVATPAFASSSTGFSIYEPSANPFTIPVDNNYNALPFDVSVRGYAPGTLVFVEVCDGLDSGDPSWVITQDCDLGTSTAGQTADGSKQAYFPANNRNTAVHDLNGVSTQTKFNCLSDNEINDFGDATPGFNGQSFPGEFQLGPNDFTTATGQAVDPTVPAWDNCQLMSTSNKSAFVNDNAFITLTVPGTFPFTPEAPMAILLPLGALGLLAGGIVLARRRRSARLAA
jgi:hypothetical protein